MGLAGINRKLGALGDFLLQWGGSLIVAFMIFSIYHCCVNVSGPLIYEDKDTLSSLTYLAFLIIAEIMVNLFCFQYYSRYNSVTYWHRQSCVADLRNYAEENEDPESRDAIFFDKDEHRNDPGYQPSGLEAVENHLLDIPPNESGSKMCVRCNRTAPARSHHCPLCKMCVLRKDHHCFVTGACVGLGNQRFFIVFLFWCTLGLLIALPHIFLLLDRTVAHWYPYGFLYYIGPVGMGRWLLGYTEFYAAGYALVFSFAVAGFFAAGGFFGMQIYYTSQGYTMYEYHNLTVRATFLGDGQTQGERFRLVFGKNWLLNFILPLPWNLPILTPAISNSLFRVRSKVL